MGYIFFKVDDNIPFDGKLQRPVKSVIITVHLSGSAIAGIVIGSIILTFIIAYGMYHGRKYYKKHYGRRAPISDMGNSYSDMESDMGNSDSSGDGFGELEMYSDHRPPRFGGGYSKLRLR